MYAHTPFELPAYPVGHRWTLPKFANPASNPTALLKIMLLCIAVLHAIGVFVKTLRTTKRRGGLTLGGLYTSALFAASTGIILLVMGYALKLCNFSVSLWTEVAVSTFGGMMMITGLELAMYSRMNMVSTNRKRDTWVLVMILVTCAVGHIPTAVLYAGSEVTKGFTPLAKAYRVCQASETALFFVQETVISGLYIRRARRSIHTEGSLCRPASTGLLERVRMTNFFVIALNVGLLILWYTGSDFYASVRVMIYSIKLKVQFLVLKKLSEHTNGVSLSPTQLYSPHRPML